MPQSPRTIVLANPRGFCAGVDRAILTVQRLLEQQSRRLQTDGQTPDAALPLVYVRRQIVHNTHVVADLAAQGARFVEELDEIPDEAAAAQIPVVFSAHGVSPQVKEEADRRGLRIIDATCPLVAKVHREVQRYAKKRYEIVYIGHRGHDEAVGVVGECPEHVHLIEHAEDVESLDLPAGKPIAYLSQTTLSLDETADIIAALKRRFPTISEPPSSDICYATHNRQHAVKLAADEADAMIIVGSANSSNSVRLVEVAAQALAAHGRPAGAAHRVDDAGQLDPAWFDGVATVGVSSGASVPEALVQGVITALQSYGFDTCRTVQTMEENMHFVLPAALGRDHQDA
nr:4-hydroxy-3-methylbut-2-enyl diphosphate reductase [Pseudoscardovia suis]